MILFPACFVFVAFVHAQPFYTGSTQFIPAFDGLAYGALQMVDLDRDGSQDLIVSGQSSTGEHLGRVYYQIEDPQTSQNRFIASANLAPVWLSSLSINDYDRDGDMDFVLTGARKTEAPYEPVTQVYRNDGDWVLTPTARLPGVCSGDTAWGDADNDGDADLLLIGALAPDRYEAAVYRNDGQDTFTRIDIGIEGLAFGRVSWIDYDDDLDLDIFLTGSTTRNQFATRILRNEGDSRFVESNVTLPGLAFSTVSWADYDNDGRQDVFLTGASGFDALMAETRSILLRNASPGELVDSGLEFQGLMYGAARWFDFERDGDLDLVTTGMPGILTNLRTGFYVNQDGRFKCQRFPGLTKDDDVPGMVGASITLHDFNNTIFFDLMLAGHTERGHTFFFHVNTDTLYYKILDRAPNPPDHLAAHPDGSTVVFSWNSGSDDRTPAPGLNYAIRVGTRSGGIDVVSPSASVSSGKRYLYETGNCGSNRGAVLRNLPPGTYYWSVQSVDTAYKGSPFAPEQTFTIGGPIP